MYTLKIAELKSLTPKVFECNSTRLFPPCCTLAMIPRSRGQSVGRVYVSKHCNTQFLREGEEYNLQVQPYTLSTQPGVVHYEFIGLSHAFCRG